MYQKALGLVRFFGLAIAFLVVFINYSAPKDTFLPPRSGVTIPTVAMQFIHNSEQAVEIFGDPQTQIGKERLRKTRLTVYYDFLLIASYTIFSLALVFLLRGDIPARSISWFEALLFFLIFAAAIADIKENLILLQITSPQLQSWQNTDFSLLPFFARLKWSFFAVLFFLFSIVFYQRHLRWAAIFFLFTALLNAASFFYFPTIQYQALYSGLLWILIWIKSLPIRTHWW